MKKLFVGLVGIVILIGCKDSFDMGDLQEEAKLVVNCFPSSEDTTWIEVTHSIPVIKGSEKNQWNDFLEVNNAQVVYKVNGEQRTVEWKDRIYDKWNMPCTQARYYVAGSHHVGDRVEVEVSAPGYASVRAKTVVSEAVPVKLQSLVKTKAYDSKLGESIDVYQLSATFTDPAATEDYYAVRVRCKHYHDGTAGDQRPDSLYSHPKILIMSEPLLKPMSELDSDFGFSNSFYQSFCIFSDTDINGQTYTLHLNLSTRHIQYPLDTYTSRPVCYQVQLYHLTPEMYRYMKSINDIDNNELAKVGFSMIQPTYSNVDGGLGIVSAYNVSESGWLQLNE